MNTRELAQKIRPLIPSRVRQTVNRIGQFLTADAISRRFPSIEGGMETLRDLGFAPRFCVDVGAYQGDWTKTFKSIFPAARVLMIEAQETKRSQLAAIAAGFGSDVAIECALLGAAEGVAVDFQEMETGSSVFAEASPYARVTVKKQTRTLDNILSDGNTPRPTC